MYTCSAQEEPDRETALHALDLAHRWHAEVVVAILADLLAGPQALSGKSFFFPADTSPGWGRYLLLPNIFR